MCDTNHEKNTNTDLHAPHIVCKEKAHGVSSHLPKDVTRRDIIRFAAAGMGVAALGPMGAGLLREASGAPTTQNFTIILNLLGGVDTLNMVIPTSLPEYYTRRFMDPVTGLPTGPVSIAIPPGQELSLNGGPGNTGVNTYGLHPALPNIQQMWDNGDVAILHNMGYPIDNLSHFTSEDIYSLGVRGDFGSLGIPKSGWIARYADNYAPTPMGAVSVGVGRRLDFVGGTSNPFLVNSLATFRYLEDTAYLNNHEYRIEIIRDVLDNFAGTGLQGDIADAIGQGHDLADQIQAAVADYETFGSTADYRASNGNVYNIHRSMQDIARLLHFGFESRILYTGFGGYDTHGDQGAGTGRQANLFDRLDTAVEAFRQDAVAMGIWDQTVIILITEFGRRNFQNGSGGTDHGHGASFMAIGGGVTGGMYGNEISSADLNLDWVGQGSSDTDHGTDFRDMYRENLTDHLGADLAGVNTDVFPEPQPKNEVLGYI
ncbi:MAG: DUF1501 domain-containing protein [Planctomycetota bacterium]|jgi:uncharacterized protein (DUF1501 family)